MHVHCVCIVIFFSHEKYATCTLNLKIKLGIKRNISVGRMEHNWFEIQEAQKIQAKFAYIVCDDLPVLTL